MFENRARHSEASQSTLPDKGAVARQFATAAAGAPSGGNAALARVLAERPDLVGQPCVMPQAGLSALTFLFTDEVIKLPRTVAQQGDFQREHRILAHLHAAGLPVPAVTSVGSDGLFYSQQRLSGVHCDRDAIECDPQRAEVTARDLANFMIAAAQAVSSDDAERIGLVNTTPDSAEMQRLLELPEYKRLLREADEDVVSALTNYAAAQQGVVPVFTHADLQPENLLCDAASGRVKTVIDFGLCHYGDVAVAFHALYRYFPHDFVDQVADHYAAATGTEPVRLEQAVTARLAHELTACAKYLVDKNELCHDHRSWLRDILVEYDNAVTGYVPPKHAFMGLI